MRTFEEFLRQHQAEIPVLGFLFNLLVAAALASLLGFLYRRCGHALSNRREFSRNFVLVTLATMFVISIVKSSLALSLGLVGALSIVRFRAAIKEPEELAYLFLAIAIGLGLGADQLGITLVACAVILGLIWFRHRLARAEPAANLYLTVADRGGARAGLRQMVDALQPHCRALALRRFDDSKDAVEATFVVEFNDFSRLEQGRAALRGLGDSVTVTFLDGHGVGVE